MPPLEDDEEVKEGRGLKIINQTSSIISTNESWKQFKQIKKRNYANTVSLVSAQ